MNTMKSLFAPGFLRGGLIALAWVAGWGAVPAGQAVENDMAFTVKIKPWGSASFDLTIQNDTLEPIVGFSVAMDSGTGHKFDYITAVRFKTPVNTADYRRRASPESIGLGKEPVEWGFSRKA